ncbi:MAG: dTMP kinase [Methanobacteriaceae archaeon]|nr:dTMP kinase [Methanobacteriaceae archaeon]
MYIVFEGIDGSGKSTQINLLKNYLEKNGLKVECIVEPTDETIGRLIREFLTHENATTDNMQKTLGLLFAADRMQLMNKIEAYENEGKVVLGDRSFYSSLAYQEPQEWIKEINKFAKIPDMVLLLDIDLDKSVERTTGIDEFENKEFLSLVQKKYQKLGTENGNFKVINANNGVNLVSKDIQKAVAPLFDICVSGIL